jgi:hypothetical protein
MSEIIYVFGDPYRSSDGRGYQVQVRAAPSGHVWHEWLVFLACDNQSELETDRETIQSNRDALDSWVRGLEPLYLEGARERASRPQWRLHDRLLA